MTQLSFGALEFHDVFKIFRSGPAETVALRGFDLRIEPHELVALFGPSGSGKSTALHLAAGLDEPSAGEVRALGSSLTRLNEAEFATLPRTRSLDRLSERQSLAGALRTRECRARRSGSPDVAGRSRSRRSRARHLRLAARASDSGQARSPAVSSSGLRSQLPQRAKRRSCLPTSRPPSSMPATNRSCWTRSSACGTSSAPRSSSSRIRRVSPTAVDRVVEIRDGAVV